MIAYPPPFSFRKICPYLIFSLFVLLTFSSQAQITVDLSLKRTLYIAYEPLLVTVRINNLSGNRLLTDPAFRSGL